MKTKKDKVLEFIDFYSKVTSFDLERWALDRGNMLGETAKRYARMLITEHKVIHPNGNTHMYAINKQGQMSLF